VTTILPFKRPGAEPLRLLTPEESATNTAALSRYYEETCLAKRLKDETIKNQRRVNERLLLFAQKPAYLIVPRDYERWIASLIKARPKDKPLSVATQRFYQSAVSAFFDALVADAELQNQYSAAYGEQAFNPINARNRIVHRLEAEAEKRAWSFTHEEIDRFFEAIKRDIVRVASKQRQRLARQRDLMLYATQYYTGVRVSELVALDVNNFETLFGTEEYLGRFGAVRVRGKSSRGAPKKLRLAPVLHAAFERLMLWYLEQVRAKYKNAKTTRALFLNERGKRLSRSSAMHQLKQYLVLADLDPAAYGTHSFRRATLSHVADLADMSLAQLVGGHAFQSTTQIYVRMSEETVRARLRAVVAATDRLSKRSRPRRGKGVRHEKVL